MFIKKYVEQVGVGDKCQEIFKKLKNLSGKCC